MRDDDAKSKNTTAKIQIWMQNPGIEPGSPEPQSGILTTVRILPMDEDIFCNIKYCKIYNEECKMQIIVKVDRVQSTT